MKSIENKIHNYLHTVHDTLSNSTRDVEPLFNNRINTALYAPLWRVSRQSVSHPIRVEVDRVIRKDN